MSAPTTPTNPDGLTFEQAWAEILAQNREALVAMIRDFTREEMEAVRRAARTQPEPGPAPFDEDALVERAAQRGAEFIRLGRRIKAREQELLAGMKADEGERGADGSADNARRAGHVVHENLTLRSVHPVSTEGLIAIAFNRRDASPVRLVLDTGTAERLVDWLGTYLGVWRMGMKVQFSMSSGMRSGEGSPNDGQKVVPLASS